MTNPASAIDRLCDIASKLTGLTEYLYSRLSHISPSAVHQSELRELQPWLDELISLLDGLQGDEMLSAVERIRNANAVVDATVPGTNESYIDLALFRAAKLYCILAGATWNAAELATALGVNSQAAAKHVGNVLVHRLVRRPPAITAVSVESIGPLWKQIQSELTTEMAPSPSELPAILVGISKEGRRAKRITGEPGIGSDGGALSATELAAKYQKPKDAVRKVLERFRATSDEGWIETQNRKPREPQFLYYEAAVCDLVRGVGASTERPPKK